MSDSSSSRCPNKPRTIVLCFDGTSSEYDANNTNVVQFFSLLKKGCDDDQVCYYQAGVGTFFAPGVVSPVFEWAAKVADMAVAWYLNQHVMEGYTFLMQNYREGDKICMFGFSRGAYTARALAGMLYKVGLVPKDNDEQVPFAFKLYKRTDKEGVELSKGFKKTFSRSVKIEFMGLWDTVSSVGVLMGRSLPFTNSNTAIRTFRHALALDERRVKFRANHYHYPTKINAVAAGNSENEPSSSDTDSSEPSNEKGKSGKASTKWWAFKDKKRTSIDGPRESDPDSDFTTDVLEVWFAGCHSDVGGGAVENTVPYKLANITLRWMVQQVIQSQCGIDFDAEALEALKLSRVTLPSMMDGSKDAEKKAIYLKDALAPLNDQLKQMPLWWILEVIPLHYKWQDRDGVWHSSWGFHLGKGRYAASDHPKFHRSVQWRMEDQELDYKPALIYKPGTEVYVD